MTASAIAGPTIQMDESLFLSYHKTTNETAAQKPAIFVPVISNEQRETIRLLAQRANPPITPNDVLPWGDIAHIVFTPKGSNRPSKLSYEDLEIRWKESRIEGFPDERLIALAPYSGYVVMSDGKVYQVDLYLNDAVRLFGFMYRQKSE
jgi:hypothetical protein